MANEEREKEELGEISEDLLREHGETYPEGVNYVPGIPADVAGSAPLGDAPAILESQTQGASVRSVYDTRLINGTDFHDTQTQEITLTDETVNTLLFTYPVPESYIAVLREFEFRIFPLLNTEDFQPKVSILVNGITQVGHSNLSFVQDAGKQTTHIIGPVNSTISLRLTWDAGVIVGETISVWGHLYGNLILTTNKPAQFEVGNSTPTKPIPSPKEMGGTGIALPQSRQNSMSRVSVPVPSKQNPFWKRR